jgi:hypothetical protein
LKTASDVRAQLANRQAKKWQQVHEALDSLLAAFDPGVDAEHLLDPLFSLGSALKEVGVCPEPDERPPLPPGGYMQSALLAAFRGRKLPGTEEHVRSCLARLGPDDGIADFLSWVDQFVKDKSPPARPPAHRRKPTRKRELSPIPPEFKRPMELLERYRATLKPENRRFLVKGFAKWLELRQHVYLKDQRSFARWLKNRQRAVRRQQTGR